MVNGDSCPTYNQWKAHHCNVIDLSRFTQVAFAQPFDRTCQTEEDDYFGNQTIIHWRAQNIKSWTRLL
jgi:hypothetical protein